MTLTDGAPHAPDALASRWPRSAHLIGVAGAGLQSLAWLLMERGCRVSGSDLVSPPQELIDRGLAFTPGHATANVPPKAQAVVYSAAIPEDNVERQHAQRLKIPQFSYAEAAGRLTTEIPSLAVAGTHGKSTTCAMLAAIFRASGLDPSHLYGAVPAWPSTPASIVPTHTHRPPEGWESHPPWGGHAGRDHLLIVEACEYRQHFLQLFPDAAAILAVEPDHFDCYPSPDELLTAFTQFAARLPQDGLLVYLADDAGARQIGQQARLRCRVAFGLGEECHWRADRLRHQQGRYAFRLLRDGIPWTEVSLAVPGRHQVFNALAAAALAGERGLPPQAIAAGLARFAGLRRRLEVIGTLGGAPVVDDYAHHPTELNAALTAVRAMYPGRQVKLVFQPHQASRTGRLLDELARCLHNADHTYICDVYRAREGPPQHGEATAHDLARAARACGASVETIAVTELPHLAQTVTASDVVLAAGAGDLGKWIDELVRRFGSRSQNQ